MYLSSKLNISPVTFGSSNRLAVVVPSIDATAQQTSLHPNRKGSISI
ncbi:MAG: hypothetical protein WCJ81_01890 [bacterium]